MLVRTTMSKRAKIFSAVTPNELHTCYNCPSGGSRSGVGRDRTNNDVWGVIIMTTYCKHQSAKFSEVRPRHHWILPPYPSRCSLHTTKKQTQQGANVLVKYHKTISCNLKVSGFYLVHPLEANSQLKTYFLLVKLTDITFLIKMITAYTNWA